MYSIPTISQKPNRNQAMTQKERERERILKKEKKTSDKTRRQSSESRGRPCKEYLQSTTVQAICNTKLRLRLTSFIPLRNIVFIREREMGETVEIARDERRTPWKRVVNLEEEVRKESAEFGLNCKPTPVAVPVAVAVAAMRRYTPLFAGNFNILLINFCRGSLFIHLLFFYILKQEDADL